MTKKLRPLPIIPGSLRDLGGDGREIENPELMPQKAKHILQSDPVIAARAVLRVRGPLREGFQYLVDKNILTDRQYQLIGELLPKEMGNISRTIEKDSDPLITLVVRKSSSSTAAAIQNLLG